MAKSTSALRSSVPLTIVKRSEPPSAGTPSRAAYKDSTPLISVSPAATIRSPRSIPARSAGPFSATSRTSRPSRSGRPTARRMRRAARGGATATPSLWWGGASPLASRSTRSRTRASAGTARMSPPSKRSALRPRSRPSESTSGPPDEPRGRGAVCSMAPRTRRPRGPRKLRPSDDTKPGVARRPRPPGLASATTGVPMVGPSPGSQRTAGASPVSTSSTARSRSGSVPATVACSRRSSAKTTVTSSRRRLWALVSTRPGAMTTPEPSPQPRPSPTTDGPTSRAAPSMMLCTVVTAFILNPPS